MEWRKETRSYASPRYRSKLSAISDKGYVYDISFFTYQLGIIDLEGRYKAVLFVPNNFYLDKCTCGTCAYEDPDCANLLAHVCKVNGYPDANYKNNNCKNCRNAKKTCGETCDYCE